MGKKYSYSGHKKFNYKHLAILVGTGALLIVVLFGAGWFLWHTLFYHPFPEDASMTKEAGNMVQEIDEENGWMVRYPTFEEAVLNESIDQMIATYKKDVGEGRKVIVDYRSKQLYDHYISVLFQQTIEEDGEKKVVYNSVNYDQKQQRLLETQDILRNQYQSDLLDDVQPDAIEAIEINAENVDVYLMDGAKKTIDYKGHESYIALTDPNIPSLFQKDPLSVVEDQEIDPDKPMIALTFDDGPNPYTTPDLLDILKENDARATFFMLGTNVENYPDVVARVYQEGHEIGNHSWAHKDFSTMTDKKEIIENYQKADDAIFAACGHDASYVRPPYGSTSELYDQTIDRTSVLWSVDTRDWESHDPKAIQAAIETYAGDGSVILLHDIHKDTIDSMKKVIPMLKEKGYQLVTVDDLIRYGKI